MPLAVRTEQWRFHQLARSIPPNQRTPQSTCQSRSHGGQPNTFLQPRAFAYLLRLNNNKIDKIGSILRPHTRGDISYFSTPRTEARFFDATHVRLTTRKCVLYVAVYDGVCLFAFNRPPPLRHFELRRLCNSLTASGSLRTTHHSTTAPQLHSTTARAT